MLEKQASTVFAICECHHPLFKIFSSSDRMWSYDILSLLETLIKTWETTQTQGAKFPPTIHQIDFTSWTGKIKIIYINKINIKCNNHVWMKMIHSLIYIYNNYNIYKFIYLSLYSRQCKCIIIESRKFSNSVLNSSH